MPKRSQKPSSKRSNKRSKTKGSISIKRIGFIVKHEHEEAMELALDLAKFSLIRGLEVVFATESTDIARLLQEMTREMGGVRSKIRIVQKPKMVDVTDLIMVLGGDGTFLSIARLMKQKSVPVMGVNMGKLGFLTEVKKGEAFDSLKFILSGVPPMLSNRFLLEVTLKRKGKVIFQAPVVNDAVISKGAIARIIGTQITINGKLVSTVRADGIIVSTPTGSTAYSLAAGGPVIEPTLDAVVLTPICPHSLTHRPLVVSNSSEIQVRLTQRPGHVLLTLDGQDVIDLKEEDIIVVRRYSKHPLRIVSSPTRDYFSLLREKLKFGTRE